MDHDISVHEHFMQSALREARTAAKEDEVPTGCVIVHAKEPIPHLSPVIGKAHNQVERLKDPTAHAEILAITQAAAALNDWRLTDTILYVTKEPCVMCAGAIIQARIPLVVYGAPDPQRGGCSQFAILDHASLNHRCAVISHILENECRDLLQDFFRKRR